MLLGRNALDTSTAQLHAWYPTRGAPLSKLLELHAQTLKDVVHNNRFRFQEASRL